ncbi:MAG: DUF4111 domain-containing protein [Phycisphaeraceae bacterium]|nr:DUF4111 domain-containing protein [Phycisphaeraceae bacterium]
MKSMCRPYLSELTRRLLNELGPAVAGIYPFGSVAGGDFQPVLSDIDVLVLVHGRLLPDRARLICQHLHPDRLPCPARGLELVVMRAGIAAHPRPPLSFELGADLLSRNPPRLHLHGRESELIVDLAGCREHAWALHGPPPRAAIGQISPKWISLQFRGMIDWHRRSIHHPLDDPTGMNAVLNACRAAMFRATGRLVSKLAGAAWYLDHGPARSIVARAYELRQRGRIEQLDRDAVCGFLDEAVKELGAADAESGPVARLAAGRV